MYTALYNLRLILDRAPSLPRCDARTDEKLVTDRSSLTRNSLACLFSSARIRLLQLGDLCPEIMVTHGVCVYVCVCVCVCLYVFVHVHVYV